MKKGYLVKLLKKDNQGWFVMSITRYASKATANKIARQYESCSHFKAIVEKIA